MIARVFDRSESEAQTREALLAYYAEGESAELAADISQALELAMASDFDAALRAAESAASKRRVA